MALIMKFQGKNPKTFQQKKISLSIIIRYDYRKLKGSFTLTIEVMLKILLVPRIKSIFHNPGLLKTVSQV